MSSGVHVLDFVTMTIIILIAIPVGILVMLHMKKQQKIRDVEGSGDSGFNSFTERTPSEYITNFW